MIVPVRFVVTIHDLIHLRFPHHFKAKVRPYYETVVRAACVRAARVVTDDPRTVEDLVELLGVKRAKIRVIPLGVSESFFEPGAPFAGPRPYVLYVGNHRTHKNLATLFDAWSALPPELDVDLLRHGPRRFRRRAPAAKRFEPLDRGAGRRPGRASRIVLRGRAGAGLTLLAGGLRPSGARGDGRRLPGDRLRRFGAAGRRIRRLDVPARDWRRLAALLGRMLVDQGERERSVNVGLQAARGLTWDRCARATADVYREVLE